MKSRETRNKHVQTADHPTRPAATDSRQFDCGAISAVRATVHLWWDSLPGVGSLIQIQHFNQLIYTLDKKQQYNLSQKGHSSLCVCVCVCVCFVSSSLPPWFIVQPCDTYATDSCLRHLNVALPPCTFQPSHEQMSEADAIPLSAASSTGASAKGGNAPADSITPRIFKKALMATGSVSSILQNIERSKTPQRCVTPQVLSRA